MVPRTVPILIALAVATAGCAGIAGSPGADVPTPAPTPVPTPTPTATPGAAGLGHDLVETHLRALEEAGSFASSTTMRIETNDTSSPVRELALTTEYRVDYEHDRALRRSSFIGTSVTYTAGETTYQRTKPTEDAPAGQAVYRVSEPGGDEGMFALDPVNRTEAAGASVILVENVTYRRVGKETHGGVAVTRYEAEGADAIEGYDRGLPSDEGSDVSGGSATQNVTIESFSSVLLVDERGVVRVSDWSITLANADEGAAYTVEVRHVVEGVGGSPIEPPGWVSVAKEQAEAESSMGVGGDDCGRPSAAGEFDQTAAGDGTVDVAFTVTGIENASAVTLEYDGAELDTLVERSAFTEGETATVTGLEPGDSVTAVVRNRCDDEATVGTYTVD